MNRSNAEQIGDVLRQFLRIEGLETPLNQHRLMEAWKDMIGEGFEHYIGEMFIKDQTLYVRIKSSVLKNELMMSRSSFVTRLNKAVGSQVITDIRFI